MNKQRVIAIHGKAGTGKSTFAKALENALEEHVNCVNISIATTLKRAVSELFLMDSTDDKSIFLPEINATYGSVLQSFSEVVKGLYGRDFFIKQWAKSADSWGKESVIIIDDLRFPEEYEWLKENTDCYFIQIPGEFNVADGRDLQHISEAGLDVDFNITRVRLRDATGLALVFKERMDRGLLLNGNSIREEPASMTITDMHGRVKTVVQVISPEIGWDDEIHIVYHNGTKRVFKEISREVQE